MALGGIDLDPASCPEAQAVVRAARFHGAEEDGLTTAWEGRVWLNPPFSTGLPRRFALKALEEWRAGRLQAACLLLPLPLHARWFTDLLGEASAVCVLRDKPVFHGPCSGTIPAFVSIIYLGREPRAFQAAFAGLGPVYLEGSYA